MKYEYQATLHQPGEELPLWLDLERQWAFAGACLLDDEGNPRTLAWHPDGENAMLTWDLPGRPYLRATWRRGVA